MKYKDIVYNIKDKNIKNNNSYISSDFEIENNS